MLYPRRGEIYLVRLPGHPSDTKDRPGLVVSLDVRNRLANDAIVVPLSSTLRLAPTHV
jgi:mRNA-degrading endonuclease toxin of MazEF toxin-antitoxin module